ncbi:hypothetical protein BS78_05G261000 [Paspalum vaginatum]|nr:hypothetical protein BS78_05G261000 [Paspalum vaginatum]KAJ1277005.1 hypothetical protein BS78_05G261000 [Paspalum vaginatum]KAJ1277006.1 hypothetical protein BS78_05G261000 [Paspalum vaginatum]
MTTDESRNHLRPVVSLISLALRRLALRGAVLLPVVSLLLVLPPGPILLPSRPNGAVPLHASASAAACRCRPTTTPGSSHTRPTTAPSAVRQTTAAPPPRRRWRTLPPTWAAACRETQREHAAVPDAQTMHGPGAELCLRRTGCFR